MKEKIHDFLITLLGAVWFGIILVTSIVAFMLAVKCFFRLVGVM
jgi:hypothetical protein